MASHVSSNDATEIKVGDPVVITLQSYRRYTNQPPVEQTGIVTRITKKRGKRVTFTDCVEDIRAKIKKLTDEGADIGSIRILIVSTTLTESPYNRR